jgi:hypothetical protein
MVLVLYCLRYGGSNVTDGAPGRDTVKARVGKKPKRHGWLVENGSPAGTERHDQGQGQRLGVDRHCQVPGAQE